jgi:hypothetical protein
MMRFVKRALRACAAAALLGAALPALAQSVLQPGAPVQFTLPAQNYVSNYYIDVDASTQQLRIAISGSNANADTDLFVRYESPFPVANSVSYPSSPQLVSEDTLARWSHYHAISSSASETINVLPSGHVPLAAGRWYVAVINGSGQPTTVTLTATAYSTPQVAPIQIDFSSAGTADDPCDIAPWTDPTVVPATGGNPATTLGQQRQNALKYAAQKLSDSLQPPVEVTVHACWDHLGGDAQSAVIAQASPVTFLIDLPDQFFPGYALPLRYTWYPITAAVRSSGTSQCGLIGGPCGGTNNEEIRATFNTDIGSADVIGGEPFYYGYTTGAGGAIDFISVAMHELTHGLGFIGLANTDDSAGPIGARAGIFTDTSASPPTSYLGYENLSQGPYDDAFDVNATIVGTGGYTPFMGYEVNGSGDAARAAALVSNNKLRWADTTAVNAAANQLRGATAPQSFPLLHTPNPIVNGSTLSHTEQSGDLMNAFYNATRSTGLSPSMLAPIGWGALTTAPSYAQPIPSNWFDASHSGHGFDFQLVGRDPVFGDSYILVFYSYDANGAPEWYFAQGNLVDGVFVAGLDGNGNTLLYSTYGANHGPGQLQLTQKNIVGSVIVDFNQASKSPVCRDVDRSAEATLGVMSWSIGNDSGDWCMQALIPQERHASPDFNGHWYAPADGGWGMEILNYDGDAAASSVFVLIYYPAADGKPTWAVAQDSLHNGTATVPVYARANGYCRTCAVPATSETTQIGTLTLNLVPPSGSTRATGTASFTLNYPGGGSFSRSNDAITTLSVAPGQ